MPVRQLMLHRKIHNFRNHLPTSHIFFVTSLCFLNYFVNICIKQDLTFLKHRYSMDVYDIIQLLKLHSTTTKKRHVILRS
jgi:hypothetical protein